MSLFKDHNAVTPVRLEPASFRSRVKHSTTEPLRSYDHLRPSIPGVGLLYRFRVEMHLIVRFGYLQWRDVC